MAGDINNWLAVDVISRDGRINPYLVGWLKRHGVEHRIQVGKHGVCAARNYSVRNFLASDVPEGKTHLLQIDDDMVPLDADQAPRWPTGGILAADGLDLIYCGYIGQTGNADHFGDNSLGAACLRMSAKLLSAIEPPWFALITSADGAGVLDCECRWFLRRAQAVGYQPKMVGMIGHLVTLIAAPGSDGRPRFAWPQ